MVDVTKSKDGEVYTCKGTNSKSMEESSFVDATYTMNVLCKCFKFVRDLNSSHTQVKCAIFSYRGRLCESCSTFQAFQFLNDIYSLLRLKSIRVLIYSWKCSIQMIILTKKKVVFSLRFVDLVSSLVLLEQFEVTWPRNSLYAVFLSHFKPLFISVESKNLFSASLTFCLYNIILRKRLTIISIAFSFNFKGVENNICLKLFLLLW